MRLIKFNKRVIVRRGSCIGPIIALFALMATGCKTTEENYRAAYERTVQGRAEVEDSTIYGGMRQRAATQEISLGEETAPMKTTWVRVTDDGGGVAENIKRYCVVAGEFKQAFTARSMRERLCDNGFPGAFVVQDGEPFYYVVAAAYSDLEPAMQLIKQLRTSPPFPLREGMPLILRPAQIR